MEENIFHYTKNSQLSTVLSFFSIRCFEWTAFHYTTPLKFMNISEASELRHRGNYRKNKKTTTPHCPETTRKRAHRWNSSTSPNWKIKIRTISTATEPHPSKHGNNAKRIQLHSHTNRPPENPSEPAAPIEAFEALKAPRKHNKRDPGVAVRAGWRHGVWDRWRRAHFPPSIATATLLVAWQHCLPAANPRRGFLYFEPHPSPAPPFLPGAAASRVLFVAVRDDVYARSVWREDFQFRWL